MTEGKEALALGNYAAALAVRTDGRGSTRGRARSVAVGTGVGLVDRHPHRGTDEGVGKRQLDLDLDVTPTLGRGPVSGGTTATIEEAPEQITQVEVGTGAGEVKPLSTARSRPRTWPEGLAEGVVLLALLGIGEHVMGLTDLLEALLGRRIAGIGIGMILARQLAVRLFDLVLARPLGDAQGVVVTRHAPVQPPSPGVPLETTTRTARTTFEPSV